MSLPNCSPGGLGDAHEVAERLRHLVDAVEALEQRRGEHALRLLALLFLEGAAHEVVEQLVGAAQLDVGLAPSPSPSPGAAGTGTPSPRWRRRRGSGATKSSRSSIRATVVRAARRSTSSMPIVPSHSELRRISRGRARRIRLRLLHVGGGVGRRPPPSRARGRVADLPDGSPTWAVKSPMMRTAVCPSSWNWRSLRSTTAKPRWMSDAVGSMPELDPQRAAGRELAARSRPR